MSTMRSENRRLQQTVGDLREDRRLQDRKLRDLQRQLDEIRAKVATSVIDGTIPTLPVEVAAPPQAQASSSSRVVGVTEDGYEIVYEGDAAAGKVGVPESEEPIRRAPVERVSRARTEAPAPRVSARTARPQTRAPEPTIESSRTIARNDEATEEYKAAVELVRGGSHGDAVAALRAFLSKHARHDFADNAQYWLGEAHYAQKDYPRALVEFRNVIETYPRGNKVPDALLKVGYCYQALGQAEKSRAVLEQVVNLYPKTEPAVIAAKRLETP
jgi:tol-pal system protein YbgF